MKFGLITTEISMTNSADIIKFPGNPSQVLINQSTERVISKLGWVYVLTNESMPNIVKIGYTTQCPYARAKQLSQATGVPMPFEVSYALVSLKYAEIEARAHHILSEFRVNENREFFYQEPGEAFKVIYTLVKQIKERLCSNDFKLQVYDTAIERGGFEDGGFIDNQPFSDVEDCC